MQIKKEHIIIVSESIDVNDSSASKGRVALINNLIKIGYQVTVLHYTRKHIELKGARCIEIKEKKNTIFYVLSRAQRILNRYFKIDLSKTLESIFGFSFTFFNDVNSIKDSIKRIDNFKILITLSKGASFRPHYAVNKSPMFHDKWLAYIHDPYPFSCYPEPYTWEEPGYRQKHKFFMEVSKHAQFSVFPSLLLKNWMGNFFPNFIKTGLIIPHQNFESELENFEEPKYFDSSKFNVLHSGSLMKPRNPRGLIKGFELFLNKNPKAKKSAKLLLLGNADYHKVFIKKCAAAIPELCVQLSNVPFNEVYWLQKHVSVNIIIEAKASISPFLPGKFPHCISANKPILHLGPKNSESKRLLGEDYKYHSLIDDVEGIARCIQALYDLWLDSNGQLKLNRLDLEDYISSSFLKKQMDSLIC